MKKVLVYFFVLLLFIILLPLLITRSCSNDVLISSPENELDKKELVQSRKSSETANDANNDISGTGKPLKHGDFDDNNNNNNNDSDGSSSLDLIQEDELLSGGSKNDETELQGSVSDETKQYITVYFHYEKKTRKLLLEEYIIGVVAAEMPADFASEALKAQAVAARTYAFGRVEKIFTASGDAHPSADICTNPAHCQAWTSEVNAIKRWGIIKGISNWKKITKAVRDTKGVILVYNGKLINPVFHSNSGGRTENAEDVWEGGPVAYLKSRISYGEDATTEYKNEIKVNEEEFRKVIKVAYPGFKAVLVKLSGSESTTNTNTNTISSNTISSNTVASLKMPSYIKILGYTDGGRVSKIKLGNIELEGTEFRTLFDLKSANFIIEYYRNDMHTLLITTYGYGHGVGMSQWGANYLGGTGAAYIEILQYYYTDVELTTISEFNKKV
ncbi:MAG: SpoIID/LytB domain-containing protein [Clostridiales bacterium]|nr:SpoIID/LytB domain-containing protein [Clostridiales bacterium]